MSCSDLDVAVFSLVCRYCGEMSFRDCPRQSRVPARLYVTSSTQTQPEQQVQRLPAEASCNHCQTFPLGPTALARAGTRAGLSFEEAVKAKDATYGGAYRPTNKTCSPRLLRARKTTLRVSRIWSRTSAENKAGTAEDYLEASEIANLVIQARGTGRPRRRLSIVLQNALAYRTLRYVVRQQICGALEPPAGYSHVGR